MLNPPAVADSTADGPGVQFSLAAQPHFKSCLLHQALHFSPHSSQSRNTSPGRRGVSPQVANPGAGSRRTGSRRPVDPPPPNSSVAGDRGDGRVRRRRRSSGVVPRLSRHGGPDPARESDDLRGPHTVSPKERGRVDRRKLAPSALYPCSALNEHHGHPADIVSLSAGVQKAADVAGSGGLVRRAGLGVRQKPLQRCFRGGTPRPGQPSRAPKVHAPETAPPRPTFDAAGLGCRNGSRLVHRGLQRSDDIPCEMEGKMRGRLVQIELSHLF